MVIQEGGHIGKGPSNGGLKEDIGQNWVEVRLANWDKDAIAIANIFNEPNVIEHLSGIAPARTERDINKFRKNIGKYIPEDLRTNIVKEGLKRMSENMFRATAEEVGAYFVRLGTNAEVYVAEVEVNGEKKIVGTAILEKPSGPGKMVGTISKVAVSCDAPKVLESSASGKGIARKLIQTIDNRLNDLGYLGAEATIIRHLQNELAPLDLFKRQGYDIVGIVDNGDLAWDKSTGRFELRDIIKVQKRFRKAQVIA